MMATPPPTIAEEQDDGECVVVALPPAPPTVVVPCSPRPTAAIFKPREQLMLRANSLKKAIRQIIEHTEKGTCTHSFNILKDYVFKNCLFFNILSLSQLWMNRTLRRRRCLPLCLLQRKRRMMKWINYLYNPHTAIELGPLEEVRCHDIKSDPVSFLSTHWSFSARVISGCSVANF